MSEANLSIWDKVKHTNPTFVKSFNNGKFKGHSTDPIHNYHRATEIFGPCGVGWWYTVDRDRIEDLGEGGFIHMMQVTVSYRHNDEVGEVVGCGATKMAYKTKSGGFTVDEDAAKKSLTDAIGNALTRLGFMADVRLGMFDNDKYVNSQIESFKTPQSKQAPKVDIGGEDDSE